MRRKTNRYAASALALVLASPLPSYAQPTGGAVVSGRVSILTPSANSTVINQSTQTGIVNWQSFSLDSGSSIQFNQPNASAITLNRVLGGGASQLDGSLTANGQVWIINANGILFGKGSQINVSGLLATTSDISDSDFASGNYNLNSPSSNVAASVENAGTIHVANGGSAILSGSHVGNSGLIQADGGQIVLGGASTFTVDFDGDNLLRYAITTPVANTPVDANGVAQNAVVENSGTLTAAGGRILLTARAASNVADNVINNTGMISASSASVQNGEVVLDAGDGTVVAGGTITATGNAAGQTGGNVTLAGNTVNVVDNAVIDASGDQGGGTVAVGGGLHGTGAYAPAQTTTVGTATINANANTSGNGGSISIWSSGHTEVSGTVNANGGASSGNGGTVETSGDTVGIASTASVNTAAPNGNRGNWLLDPVSLVIGSVTQNPAACTASSCVVQYSSPVSQISATTINNALKGNGTPTSGTDVTLQAVDDITINSAITGTGTGHLLTLDAGRSIFVNANINMTGNAGTVVLSANDPTANRTDPGAGFISGAGVINADFIKLAMGGTGADGSSIGTALAPLNIGTGNVAIQTSGANAYVQSASAISGLLISNVNVGSGSLYATSTGNLTIAAGALLTSSSSGDGIVLSAAQKFINNAGSGAVVLSGGGRFLIYSAGPSGDTFGGLNSGNSAVWGTVYPTSVSVTGSRYVFALQPTLTFTSQNAVKTYGVDVTGAIGTDYSVSGYQPGIAGVFLSDSAASAFGGAPGVTSLGAGAGATVAGGPYQMTIGLGTLTSPEGYAFNFVSTGTLTINKAALLVTANDQSMTYGGAMPTLTVSYSGLVNGDTAANLTTAPTVISATSSSANAGVYAGTITASGAVDSNYTISYAAGTLTINKAALLITANDQSMTYGGAMPTLTESYSGFVNGDTAVNLATAPTVVSATPATANAGVYAGTITASGAVDGNYTISYAAGTLTINKAALLITANNQFMTYGGAMPTLTASYSGFVNGDTSAKLTTAPTVVSATPATANAGVYAGTITASGAVDGNYAISYAAGTLTINQALLSVTANTLSKVYGSADPTLTYDVSGLVNGDTNSVFTGALSRASGENVGTYLVSQGTLSAGGNYTIDFTGANFSITQALLNVTANTQSKVYGSADPALTYKFSGLENGDTSAVFTGGLTRAPGENVGSYAIGQGTLSAGSNYTIDFAGANLTITQALLSVVANPQSKVYGSADPALTYTFSGLENGDTSAVFTGGLTRAPGENVGSYAISLGSLSAGSNYSIAYAGANLSISQALLSVTANTQSKVYGSPDPSLTYTFSGLENGDTSAVFTGGLTRALGENVGSYAIGQGTLSAGSNYTIDFAGANLSITQALLSVVANPQSKVYGSADPTLTYSFSGLENGDTSSVFTGSLTRSAGANVGNYAITQGTLSAGGNYTINFTGANFSITQALLNVTANTASKVFGTSDPALSYSFAGLVNGDTSTVFSGALARAGGENVGSYAITQGTLSAGSNYTIDFTGANFSITQALLNVTANTQTKSYGAADPSLSYVATGFVNGDTSAVFTGSLTRAAGENVGSYAITRGTLSAGSNYTINFTGANLSITQALLNVTANTQSKVFGSADPSLTYSYSGLVNGDTSAVFTGNLTRAPGENVGSYAIGQGTLSAGSNYTIAYTGANLTITQALLNVTANPQSKVYGSPDPTLTYVATGFLNGDSASLLSGTLTRAAGENVGSYAISQGTLSAGSNYTIAFSAANLSITPATLTYTANTANRTYGAADPAFSGNVTGFVNGDTQASATSGSLSFTSSATASSNVGQYAIDGSGLSANNGNYVFVQAAANATALTINPATLTYVANSGSIQSGSTIPVLTGTVTGFVNDETQASATTGSLAFTTAATSASPAGSYAISGSGLSANNGNYVFVQDPGNATALTINAVVTQTIPPELNNVVASAIQTDNSQSNGSNTPLTLPTGDSGGDTGGGLYNVVGHGSSGQTPPSANTVVLSGPIAQLVADSIFSVGYVESPTAADRASSALTNHFVSSFHDNFSSWGNDAFWSVR